MTPLDHYGALLLGVDVGTSSAKAVLADTRGEFFATATEAYQYSVPSLGGAEQDPDDWWRGVCAATRSLLESNPDAAKRVTGIAISGQGVAAVVLDAQNKALRKAMLWMDTRPSSQAASLELQAGVKIAAISGKQAAAYNVEPKLMWLREHEPELWSKVNWFTTTTGYVTYRLTGRRVMNHSDAGILLSYDLKQRCWSDELIHEIGLSRALYPELAECDEVIGYLSEEAASEIGLLPGIAVMAGGEDTSSAGLAMGVYRSGDVQLSMGMACTVYTPTRKPTLDARLLAFPHVVRGLTLIGGSLVSGGVSIGWVLKIIGETEAARDVLSPAFQRIMQAASRVSAGCDGLVFLPYLAGELQPVNDGFARGVFFGLGVGTEPAHLLRAVMEGTAFAVRHNLDIARHCGSTPQRLIATGGPSRNDVWCQIITDITGLPMRAMEEGTGAALGDAILAAKGAGLIDEPMGMQLAHAKVRSDFKPQNQTLATYDRLYAVFRELYPRLRDQFPQLQQR